MTTPLVTPATAPAVDPTAQQLGEVIGTLRMTVEGLKETRASIEKLAERAAFKADLEQMQRDLLEKIEDLGEAVAGANAKASQVQRMMWMGTGAFALLTFLLRFIEIPARLTIGGP